MMKTSETPLNYPVPWAENSNSFSIGKAEEYLEALADAGFEIKTTSSRKEFALEFFRKWKKKMSVSKSPPPLGLHLVMGENFFEKLSISWKTSKQDVLHLLKSLQRLQNEGIVIAE